MIALKSRTLTDTERAAIVAYMFGFFPDWKTTFVAATGSKNPSEITSNPYFADYVSKWKTSAKVKSWVNFVEQRKSRMEDDILMNASNNERPTEDAEMERDAKKKQQPTAKIDYSNPENQKNLLNDIINEAKDSGEQLDALKIIYQTQRDDRQAAKEGKQVRAYVPKQCSECPLYKAQAEKIAKRV